MRSHPLRRLPSPPTPFLSPFSWPNLRRWGRFYGCLSIIDLFYNTWFNCLFFSASLIVSSSFRLSSCSSSNSFDLKQKVNLPCPLHCKGFLAPKFSFWILFPRYVIFFIKNCESILYCMFIPMNWGCLLTFCLKYYSYSKLEEVLRIDFFG